MTQLVQIMARARLLSASFDARAPRERLLLIGAALAAVLLLGDSLWLSPALKQWTQARARHLAATTALQHLNHDIARQGNEARAQELQLRQEIARLRERVQLGGDALRGSALIAAADMLPVLDQLLTRVGSLRMQSMQSLGRTEITAGAMGATGAAAAASAATKGGPVLYRHGVELTVEGSFADLLAYLQALEAMPQRVLWAGAQLKVERHPKASLTLRLYTLSLDRTWLAI